MSLSHYLEVKGSIPTGFAICEYKGRAHEYTIDNMRKGDIVVNFVKGKEGVVSL